MRSLHWIELTIERKAIPGEIAIASHARALDMGLERVNTLYVLSIHTDTLVKRPEWLDVLIGYLETSARCRGCGIVEVRV